MTDTHRLDCFAIAAPGLEPLVAGELRALGIDAAEEQGGASWTGTIESVARANLWLRSASRVVVRFGHVRARTFPELERAARRLPWERFIAPGQPVSLRVTCRKSRLYHSGAVAQRLAESIEHRIGVPVGAEGSADADEEADTGGRLVIARMMHDECTVSVDSSGSLLHLRGYRQAVAKAPLRETLAAAVLLACDWRGNVPLVDPMCGSGTIPIEAALLARRIAPGRKREFAFLHWPEVPETLWPALLAEADEAVLPRAPVPIAGSDRDMGAIDAARANAERAGVLDDIEFSVRPVSGARPPESAGGTRARGLVLTNPPYGVRVGEENRLRDLFAAFGTVLRREFAGWTVAMLSAKRALDAQLRIPMEPRLATRNGGIPVRLMVGTVSAGSARPE